MIRFHAFGTAFVLPLLTLLAPMLASRLGLQIKFGQLAVALAIHEVAHVFAAKISKVRICEVRLSPFGGSARMENPYGLTAFQLFSVAISGPLSNLLAAIVLAALTHWDILPFLLANEAIRINLMLFLFNLLPVLPLDGGRILYCILQRPLGRTKAMRFGIHLGRSFSGFLACIAICIFFHYGKLNLSLIFSAVFILLSAQDEKDALMQSTLTQLCPSEDIPLPARIYQVKTETTIASALSLLRPKEACWFLLSKDKQPVGIVSGQALLEYLKHDGSCYAKLSELPRYQLSLSKQC